MRLCEFEQLHGYGWSWDGRIGGRAIVNIIPIQVIPNVPMVEGKSGYVVVNVTNYGTSPAKAYVQAWFNGESLMMERDIFYTFGNWNNHTVDPGQNVWFVFKFNPDVAGDNLTLNASVEEIS